MSGFSDLAARLPSPEALQGISDTVAAVEAELGLLCKSEVSVAEKVGLHTLEAGGKRLRPAFVALAAEATGRPFESRRVVRLGACMEMIHMATLIHDDVIDHSPLRRGRPTASAVYGATESVLAGDGLLAKAMVVLAEDGDLAIIRSVAKAVVEMAEGEVRELETRDDFDLSEEEHLRVLRMKTAAFIEACCMAGAQVAGASDAQLQALKTYGHHIGMAFQIVDDLLDYRGEKENTGKVRATDFREGCATLPLIYLRSVLTEQEREVARLKFGNGVTDDELAMISDWMGTRGAFQRAQGCAEDHIAKARHALTVLPESIARDVLDAVADFVLARKA